jgi:hypothetical protein
MMLLIKVNEQLADVTPHLLTDCGKALQPVDFLPVRENELINPDQGRVLMVCFFENLLQSVLELFFAGNALLCHVFPALFVN